MYIHEQILEETPKREQITTRPLVVTIEKLKESADKMGMKPSTLYALVLDKYAKNQMSTKGAMILERDILKDTYGDQKRVEENAKKHAERKFASWQVSDIDISMEKFEERICDWYKIQNMPVKITSEKESKTFVVNHGVDKQWSKFQCLLNKFILEEMGETVKYFEFTKLLWTIIIAVKI